MEDLELFRRDMWSQVDPYGTGSRLVKYFASKNDEIGKFVTAVLSPSLQLPLADRESLVWESLAHIVDTAVAAVQSIDATKIRWPERSNNSSRA